MQDVVSILMLNAAVLLTIMLALWALSIRLGDVSFIDSFWAFGFVIVAWITFFLAGGDATGRNLLITGLTTVWGLRLGGYLFYRWRKEGPDKRYVALLNKAGEKRHRTSLQKVFLLQGVVLWIVSLPVQLGQAAGPAALGPLAYAGALLCVVGIAFETIGDWQLMKFKENLDNAGKALDRGLWRYTRHPNYFGDACVWWGLFLIAAETSLGLFSIVGPMLLTFLLVKWSGAALLERRLKRSRPEYADYIARTSAFIPMPPKRAKQAAALSENGR